MPAFRPTPNLPVDPAKYPTDAAYAVARTKASTINVLGLKLPADKVAVYGFWTLFGGLVVYTVSGLKKKRRARK